MEPDRLAAQSSAEPDDELYRLVVAFRTARGEGNNALAMRYIDRARRIAPDRPEINFLYGQLLLGESPHLAIPFLEKAAETQASAHFEAAMITALLANGETERADARLVDALGRFAVAPAGALAKLARRMAGDAAKVWPGWVGVAPDLKLYGELLGVSGAERLTIHDHLTPGMRHYLVNRATDDVGEFEVRPGRAWPRRIIEARARESSLLGGPISYPPDFNWDGRGTLSDNRLNGWVRIGWTAVSAVQVLISGHKDFRLHITCTPDLLDPRHHRFSIDRELCAEGGNRLVFSAMLPDGSYARLPDSPLLIEPPKPPAPRRLRSLKARNKVVDTSSTIDVIIPVYDGIAETMACIQSVLDTTGRPGQANVEVVVIDDASPDPDMGPALDVLAVSGRITLLRNARNLGFPRTVNRGFALHEDRDVVVLNADTEVYGDWLDRLRAAAWSSPDIGSVTPLTNSGSIASYPKSEDDCSGEDAVRRDDVARTINDGIYVQIPTGVGFCIYLRRDCLARTGYFDTTAFGRGYGEENDLCLRATGLGWRHILATNIFVRHLGSRSFGTRRSALFERNNRLINLRYPGYDAKIQAFLAVDPAQEARRRLDEEFLAASRAKHVLIVTLALEGGVRRAVNERVAAWRDQGFTAISLKPAGESSGRCLLSVDGGEFGDLTYTLPADLPALFGFLQRLSIESVEIHHFIGLSPDLIEALFELGCGVDIWVHDYVWYCPRITLLGAGDVYCGEPAVPVCEVCVEENGSILGEPISVAALRERSARWLSAATTVIVPSESLAARLRTKFPGVSPRVLPLEEVIAPSPARREPTTILKVAVIGAIGIQKGYNVLLAAARDAAARDLPIEFVVIGYTKDDNELRENGKVFITGQYEESEVGDLISRESPDIALFASVFPETWCYALTHAVKAGLPVAAFDFGAIAERLRDGAGSGILFPLSSTAAELNDGLLEAFPVLPRAVPAIVAPIQRDIQGQYNIQETAQSAGKYDFPHDNLPANRSRYGMVENLSQLTASVELLPLVKGLYLFSVGATNSRRVGDDHELVLPALQVGLGPGTPLDQVEFMYGPRTEGAWLCEARDHIVVKVKASSSILLLTSIRAQGMAALEIDVKRLDGPQQATRPAAAQPQRAPEPPVNVAPRAPLALPVQRKPPADPSGDNATPSIPLRVTVHVQRRGDMIFNASQWAGVSGQRLSVESFSILPLDELSADLIEYKAVTASGVETPWITGGALCGTRGMGMPLVGFAVRLKPHESTRDYVCEYSAVMVSGATLGPARDGAPCRSVDIGDPIEAIWISIKKSNGAQRFLDRPKVQTVGVKAPKSKPAAGNDLRPDAEQPKVRAPAAVEPPKPRPPVGPRFSVFRDPVE